MGRSALPLTAALLLSAATTAEAQSVVDVTLTSVAGTVDLGPGYAAETAWTYDGQLPGPVLRVTEGQTLRVRYVNQLAESSIVHWHGQPVPLSQDGAGGISRPDVATGQELRYELTNLVPGTYWYHPHSPYHHHQGDRGLYGVLIVDPADPSTEPQYDLEQIIVLDDWLRPFGTGFQGHLINGRTSAGQAPITVNAGQRLRLRFVNCSARTNYVIALDGHPMTVTHSDGARLQDVVTDALPIGIGERYDVIVDCNNPGTWSLAAARIQNRGVTVVRGIVQYSGQSAAPPAEGFVPTNLSSGSLLDYSQLASYFPSPITATPNLQQAMTLGMSMSPGGMQFTINGQAWPNVVPVLVATGDTVQFDYGSQMMGGMGYHPMHLHGHSFRLMGTAGGTTHAPIKDIVLLRPLGQAWDSASVQFTADNPGRWLMHCHDNEHMMMGMMTSVDYTGDSDGDGIGDAIDMEPTLPVPVVTIPEDGAAFLPGATGDIRVQWQPNMSCKLYASWIELTQPMVLPPYGSLFIDPTSVVGTAFADPQGIAQLPYVIPNAPALSGFRLFLQPLCATQLIGRVRLGTMQPFTVR